MAVRHFRIQGLVATVPTCFAAAVAMLLGALLPTMALAFDHESLMNERSADRIAAAAEPVPFIDAQAEPLPMAAVAMPRMWVDGAVETIPNYRPQATPGGVSTRLIDVSHRVWLGWGRAAVGFGLGEQIPRGDRPGVIGIGADPGGLPPSSRPVMSVGWRYDVTASSSLYAGAATARNWGSDDALPQYRAKAGVEWKSATSRLGFDGGRLGLQLDSGYRMSIRTRSGGVQVALRRAF